MSKFINTMRGFQAINLDFVVKIEGCEIPNDCGNGTHFGFLAHMKDGLTHEIPSSVVTEDFLTSELIPSPASAEDKAIVGFYSNDEPAFFQACKVVAWRIGACGAVPVLNDYNVQQCANSIVGLIQWDGSVTVPTYEKILESVEAFKEYVASFSYRTPNS